MGLDAYVTCNCFEEGKLSNPPEPFTMDDVCRDEEGFLCSHMLDSLRKSLDYSDYIDRHGALDDCFHDWADHACEHENGEYCSEWVGNWTGVREFQSVVEELGGNDRYPVLSGLIPDSNGGCFLAKLAKKAIEEIDDLVESARSLVFNSLVCEDSESPIWSCADHASHPILMGSGFEMGMEGDAAYFVDGKGRTLKSRRFRQDPIGPEGENGSQEMVITLHETGERIRSFDSIGPYDAPKVAREFWVEPREAPFMCEGRYCRAERIRSLLVASAETGNPIRWC